MEKRAVRTRTGSLPRVLSTPLYVANTTRVSPFLADGLAPPLPVETARLPLSKRSGGESVSTTHQGASKTSSDPCWENPVARLRLGGK